MTQRRLFDYTQAFDHPVTCWITAILAGLLLVTPLIILLLTKLGIGGEKLSKELWLRYLSWLVLVPLMVVPVLLGAAWLIGGVTILSMFCYREYARATGLFREHLISAGVTIGILAVMFAVADHWYGFFVALFPLSVTLIAALGIFSDRPQGYIQRVGLGVLGFMLFGSALGHLGYMANDANYRPIVLMILLTVEMNDVFGFVVGKSLGHRKLAPNTSPGKTIGGAIGALVLTTVIVAGLGHFVFQGTVMDSIGRLLTLGVLVSGAGMLGDLMLSSIKRDLGIKDMGVTIPGHGGLLDRFDSLLLVAPCVFHYVGYYLGFGLDQPIRIMTGG